MSEIYDGFLVWRRGAREPEAMKEKYTEASELAKELSQAHPGAIYDVLEAVSTFQNGKVWRP